MELDTIIQLLSNPERLNDPKEINTLQSYLNFHITDLEDQAWQRQLVASTKLNELSESESVAKATILWKVSNEYRLWLGLEKTLKQLKRYRSDLRERVNLLTNRPTRY